ncbi:NAD(P)H-dependent flavin oxidoreductase [Alkalihalobacterium bogoriense]|uniref:NAD(P)H-dependent flavin oxidoreductase n=1 Tax=Alkalihalobacterium bogoriense TaxID=246272 RepID=UPI00047DBD75|nr:DUF561 domain-containing protein [Alkalihalobacterium bogoriense]
MNILCKKLKTRYPIIQGGMGNISHAELTAAISEAGGLGTLGAGTMAAEEVEREIIKVKQLTTKPFCLNIPIAVQPDLHKVVSLVFTHHIRVVSLSAGNPAPFIEVLKEKGVTVICVVASVKQAQKAEKLGADIIVAEGFEAAGINSSFETTTLTLIPQVVKAVSIPVVAAGGIGNGAGLLAILALGASGVQMGTRFIATKEAVVHPTYKELLLKSNDTGTTVVGRSIGKVRRLLHTSYTETLQQMEQQGVSMDEFNEATNEVKHRAGAIEGKIAEGHLNAGQISGLIDDVPSVKDLLETMVNEAKEKLSHLQQSQLL